MDNEYVSWEYFSNAAIEHIGAKRWQTIFSENSEYSISSVQYWKKYNRVPINAYNQILYINLHRCDDERFKGFHTTKFFNRVIALSNDGYSIKRISELLTLELNRKITEGSVKSARFRNKDKIGTYISRNNFSF